MKETSRAKHLDFLDGLRGVAALYVVFHHAYSYVQWSVRDEMPAIVSGALDFFSHGRYSVDVFIVLSGFCLMLPVITGNGTLGVSDLVFFQRRAWRIIPTYYLAMAFSWVLSSTIISQKTGTLWDLSVPVTPKSILPHLLLIHDLFNEDNIINYVFWSIAVEWRIYFLFPLLLSAWRTVGGVTTTIIALFSSVILFFTWKQFDPEGLTAYYIGLFALGMLGASIAFSESHLYDGLKKFAWQRIFFFLTGLVVLFSALKLPNGKTIPYYLQDILVGLWTAALLIALSQDKISWVHKLLSHKISVFVGSFAYSIYLIHAPLLQIFWQYPFAFLHGNSLPMFLALSLVGTPLIVVASYLFFLLCERPFLRRKSRNSTKAVSELTRQQT